MPDIRSRTPSLRFVATKGLALATLVFLWWLAAAIVGDTAYTLTGPYATLVAFVKNGGQILLATVNTMWASIRAFGLSATVSALLVLGATLRPLIRETILPLLIVFRAAPIIVIAPIVYGLTSASVDGTRITMGALICLFPMTLLPLRHVNSLPPDLVAAVRAMGATPFQVRKSVHLPWSVRGFVQGLRVGASLSIIGVVVSEMIYPIGIGRLIITSNATHQTGIRIAAVLAITLTSWFWTLLVDKGATHVENRFFGVYETKSDNKPKPASRGNSQ